MADLIPLADIDPALVEELLDRAFEPGRHKRTAYRIREGMDWLPGLSFAAIDADGVPLTAETLAAAKAAGGDVLDGLLCGVVLFGWASGCRALHRTGSQAYGPARRCGCR